MTRVLHAALMPFPSPQGTQGAVASMVRSLRARGDDVRLFVSPHGDGRATDLPLVRPPRVPFGAGLRSGPTFGRAALDAFALPFLARAARGRDVLAHNVEAATAVALCARDFVYVAHTRMSVELPYYAPPNAQVARAVAPLGHGLDVLAAARATVVAAISPKLVVDLEASLGRSVRYLPVPWPRGEHVTARSRAASRAALGLDDATRVLVYTGNLDRYQGAELLLPTLASVRARADASLVIATQSDTSALLREARAAGLAEHVHVRPLRDEPDRAHAHAVADVVIVPRTCEGGVPIKLLDALARGVPAVVAHEATAGLPLGAAALRTRADAESLAAACLLAAPDASRVALRDAGLRYLDAHHGEATFLSAHDVLLADLRDARARRGRARREGA